MKTRSKIIIIVAVVVVVLLVVYAYEATLGPGSSPWSQAADYPLTVGGVPAVAGQQCFNSTIYIYCAGGQDADGGPRNNVYSAAVSATSHNITSWTSLNPYPQNADGQSCVAYAGYVYCVGGTHDGTGDDVATSDFAPLNGNGTIGSWTSTTSYPIPTDSMYCAAYSAHIYCVAGNNETDGNQADATPSNSVWYASLSTSGIGSWVQSTAYPANIYFPSCFNYGSYIYCLGGEDINGNTLSTAYYAHLTSTGVGAWTSTTPYPISVLGQACAISSSYIYCVGGAESLGNPASYSYAVYYASMSSSGIGAWKQSGPYPLSAGTACVIYSGYMYCVGGFLDNNQNTQSTYYIALTTLTSTTT
jgi:N-acetylneuraminic acid mutarotase